MEEKTTSTDLWQRINVNGFVGILEKLVEIENERLQRLENLLAILQENDGKN